MVPQELRGSDWVTAIRARGCSHHGAGAAVTTVFFLCNHTAGQTWAVLLNRASPNFPTGQLVAADFNIRDS